MIKSIDFPNRTFETKKELHLALKANKDNIVALKKAKSVIKYSPTLSISDNTIKNVSVKDNHILAVINTTNYMDSHNDVHMVGLWNKSAHEQQNKIYYIANHDLSIGSVIAYPKDVNIKLIDTTWKDLGYNIAGNTQALCYEVNKSKIDHKEALKIIKEGIDIQHSVSMQYVNVFLCIKSDEEDLKEENDNYNKYISEVVNVEKVEEESYFWAVTEAKIYREGSMVLGGSNDLTPLIQGKNEPLKNTQSIIEPSKDTQKNSLNIYNFN